MYIVYITDKFGEDERTTKGYMSVSFNQYDHAMAFAHAFERSPNAALVEVYDNQGTQMYYKRIVHRTTT